MVSGADDRKRSRSIRLGGDSRGQAYTLEGFVGALILLVALLYFIQAVVLTPTTAGTIDQDVKGQLQTEAHDVLVISADRGELRGLALYWNNSSQTFAHAYNQRVGYAQEPPCTLGPTDTPEICDAFGERLNDTFTSQGFVYNLYVDHQTSEIRQTNTTTVVYRGVPSSNAVTATYTLTLYDDMTLTAPEDADGRSLDDLDSSEFYAADVDDGPVYNIVEVRLVIW